MSKPYEMQIVPQGRFFNVADDVSAKDLAELIKLKVKDAAPVCVVWKLEDGKRTQKVAEIPFTVRT